MIIKSLYFETYQIYFMTLCLERKKKKLLEQVKKPRWVFLMPPSKASIPTPSQNGTNQPNAWSLRHAPRCADHIREQMWVKAVSFQCWQRDCKCSANMCSNYLYSKHVAEIQVSNTRGDALEIVALARALAWWCIRGFSAFPSVRQVNGFCLGSLYWAVMAHTSAS